MIHPTAIIGSNAEIGDDCQIGPYCVIGPNVKLGPNCRLVSHVNIDGHTTIGSKNEFYPFTSIGLRSQDLKWRGGVTYTIIGDENTFREGVTVHSGTGDQEETRIGSNNNILAYCHIAHNCILGNHIIMSNNSGLAGHVVVDDRAVFGGIVGVHQFCTIGRLAMVGGCSRITQDVAPFTLAEGNPARTRTLNTVGLSRSGMEFKTVEALKGAFHILFKKHRNAAVAIEEIEGEGYSSPEITELVTFFQKSQRGVLR